MRALSIRQPYAELILRGIKKIEYRSRSTKIIRERFYIYVPAKDGEPEAWIQLEADPEKRVQLGIDLPTGVIVGTATIDRCIFCPANGHPRKFEWHLGAVARLDEPIKPVRKPQPAWFRPF